MVMTVALALAKSLKHHTARGGTRAARWGAFAAELKRRAADPKFDASIFNAYLAYAVALGQGAAWLQAAKRAKLPAPIWFHAAPTAPTSSQALKEFEKVLTAAGALPSSG
jgi:hypothetical protein